MGEHSEATTKIDTSARGPARSRVLLGATDPNTAGARGNPPQRSCRHRRPEATIAGKRAKNRALTWGLAGALGLGLASGPATATAAADESPKTVTKSLCVFDPGGANGDLFAKIKHYQNQAATWGVRLELKPYTDESVAASDFRNRQCDAVLLTGLTGKEFNPKTYAIEAMGLFRTYDRLRKVIEVLATPKAAKISRHGDFETVGIYPAGAVYLHLRDRERASLAALSGRTIATIAGDRAALAMVKEVGAIPQASEISNFAAKFNNGGVDVCYSPATAYQPLELYKGVGKTGGVVRFPLAQLTFQLYIRSAEFPADFGNRSRSYVSGEFATMLAVIKRAEATIDHWIEVDAAASAGYHDLLQRVRSRLVGDGVYHPMVIKLEERLPG